ncbi:SLC13 family permease [Spirillospora sp. CA-255316]
MTYFISIFALVALFTIATLTSINMGVLAFAAAFVIGPLLSGMSIDDILGEFPANIFVIIVGITLLFGIARANGSIDLLVTGMVKAVRGRRWAVVWLMFVLGAVLMSLGSVLAVGMLAPIAMPIAKRYKIDPLLMGMMISHGVLGAAFSPITVYGAFVNGWLSERGLSVSPAALFLIPLGLNFLMAAALFLVRGRGLLRAAEPDPAPDDTGLGAGAAPPSGPAPSSGEAGGITMTAPPLAGATVALRPMEADDQPAGFTPLRVLTLTGMLILFVSAAVFGVDVGIASMCIAAVLLVFAPERHKSAINNVSWSAVVLVCGMLTYMSVLEKNGTLEYMGKAASSLGSPLLTGLVLCLAVAAISAIGSSIGTLGVVLPLAAPMLMSGELPTIALVAALSFCTVVVDVSPFSSNGVMVLANAQVDDRTAFQRRLLRYCVLTVLVAPLLATIAVLAPASL